MRGSIVTSVVCIFLFPYFEKHGARTEIPGSRIGNIADLPKASDRELNLTQHRHLADQECLLKGQRGRALQVLKDGQSLWPAQHCRLIMRLLKLSCPWRSRVASCVEYHRSIQNVGKLRDESIRLQYVGELRTLPRWLTPHESWAWNGGAGEVGAGLRDTGGHMASHGAAALSGPQASLRGSEGRRCACGTRGRGECLRLDSAQARPAWV